MPVGGRKVPPVAVEKEQATVASTITGREVELTTEWNRMFEPRVLTDIGPDGFAAISALPGGESLEWCYGCGKCVPVCPVDMVGDYGPRKIHRKVQTGTQLLADADLWLCTTCANCLRVCPKQVDMIAIMPAVREAALTDTAVPAELQDVFEKTFRHGNALGQNQRRRSQWADSAGVPVRILAKDPSPVDVLFYVEDYWSFHPRGQGAGPRLRGWPRRWASIGRSSARRRRRSGTPSVSPARRACLTHWSKTSRRCSRDTSSPES